jgi:hypothetical protein
MFSKNLTDHFEASKKTKLKSNKVATVADASISPYETLIEQKSTHFTEMGDLRNRMRYDTKSLTYLYHYES